MVPKILDEYPAVVDDLDFAMINIHPYWAEISITNAVAWTVSRMAVVHQQISLGKSAHWGDQLAHRRHECILCRIPNVVPSTDKTSGATWQSLWPGDNSK